MTFPYQIMQDGSITALVLGDPVCVASDHKNYAAAKAALQDGDEEAFVLAADLPRAIKDYVSASQGRVTVEGGVVMFADEEVHNVLAEHILNMMKQEWPIQPLLNFLDNLMDNPSKNSVEQLFKFLQKNSLVITEDGHFLAYKAVTHDYKDKHSGKVDNSIGAIVEMMRNKVNEDPSASCSFGFHVGTLSYVNDFASTYHDSNHDNDKKIIVKVNPRDAVAVPHADAAKMRVCRYEVIADFNGELKQAVCTEVALQKMSGNCPNCDEHLDDMDADCPECGL